MAKSIAFITDVAIRSMEGASVTERDGYLVIRTADNPGFWWGNFLLLDAPPEPGTASQWLDRFAAEFPAAGHVALGIDTTDAGAVIPADFIDAGLEPERSVTLTTTDVTEPAHVNTEAEIRPLAADDDWEQSVDLSLRLFASEGLTDLAYYQGRTGRAHAGDRGGPGRRRDPALPLGRLHGRRRSAGSGPATGITRFSVMIAVTSSAGVTSNA
jgi:hypothetical protein